MFDSPPTCCIYPATRNLSNNPVLSVITRALVIIGQKRANYLLDCVLGTHFSSLTLILPKSCPSMLLNPNPWLQLRRIPNLKKPFGTLINSVKVFITLIGTCSHGAVVHKNFWNAMQRTSGKLQNHKGTWEALTWKLKCTSWFYPSQDPLLWGHHQEVPRRALAQSRFGPVACSTGSTNYIVFIFRHWECSVLHCSQGS